MPAAVLTGVLVLAGCGSDSGSETGGGVSVSGAYMPQPVSDDMTIVR